MKYLAALLLLATHGALSAPLEARQCAAGADGLHVRAAQYGKYFGTAVDNPALSDAGYMAALRNTSDFGQLTVGNPQKWDYTEPSRNNFQYGNADAIVNEALRNKQMIRCHTLVWHNQLPSWVSNGNFDRNTLISIIRNHITNVVTHFKGKCTHWDVVNEAIEDDGSWRRSVFYNTLGTEYLSIAFAAAAAADPSAKLYYNDYNIESSGSKTNRALEIVRIIKNAGVKIDGVGLQAHLIGGQVPSASALQANLKAFTDLGVEVAYTELDIRIPVPAQAAAVRQQSTDYANVVTACKNTPKCVGITIWDFPDDYSWVPSVFPGYGAALPFDANNKPKDAYWAILDAWGKTSSTPCTSAPPTSSTQPATTRPPTSTTPPPTSTTAPATGGGTVPLWGQCGGIGYTGPTVCAQGTCKKSNDWYSQCLN